MNFNNKKIGIWGFGIVGKSALRFFAQHDAVITILEQKMLSAEERALIEQHGVQLLQCTPDEFFAQNDYVLASPGIDLRPYLQYRDKFLTELDIFQQFFKKPYIGITGTIGKTTVTTLITQALEQAELSVAAGGNIGLGMLDLLKQHDVNYAVLELSSFQLEYAQNCKPAIAIITNLYPNHLDRHHTLTEYGKAKLQLIAHQQSNQHAIINVELRELIKTTFADTYAQRTMWYVSDTSPSNALLDTLMPHEYLIWSENNSIVLQHNGVQTPLKQYGTIPTTSFALNWLFVAATLQILGKPVQLSHLAECSQQEHRTEYVATVNGIAFYNDSKATIPHATIAAVHKLKSAPIILLLGGLSKGVDRTALLSELAGNVKQVICFGDEARQLHEAAQQYNVSSSAYKKLEDAFNAATLVAQPCDIVLLSPGGSSFDLFKDYKERGNRFKELVAGHAQIIKRHQNRENKPDFLT